MKKKPPNFLAIRSGLCRTGVYVAEGLNSSRYPSVRYAIVSAIFSNGLKAALFPQRLRWRDEEAENQKIPKISPENSEVHPDNSEGSAENLD